MSILIAEDNPVGMKLLEFNLQKYGYHTIGARTGKEALEYLASEPGVQLVIADIMMPEMDGLELLAKMKERPEWRDIPVIMCTAASDRETVTKAARLGCKHYLVKPINAWQLVQRVREAIGDEKPVLRDKAQVISQLGLDAEAYEEMVNVFARLVAEKIDQLGGEKGEVANSPTTFNLSDLKEAASLLGAERLNELLTRVGERDKEEESKRVSGVQTVLLEELKRLREVLEGMESKKKTSSSAGKANKEGKKKKGKGATT